MATTGTRDAGQPGSPDSSTTDALYESGMPCGTEAPCTPPFEACLAVPGFGMACCHEQGGAGMCRPCDAGGPCPNQYTSDAHAD